ncbi:retron Ec67 family RNA-directed DNA polymerase/endonuclease [Streptococcus mutans]|uniref:retron Ec67 family RNA-directed DNA polymerase/endonuclease n=1 Tax=Streptococcus mutans TaxID=1309 RepID=UPI00228382DD|nr:retron Ec67 family RNA-directed DNA polymerase/endonuclease [Streptococcus mutans]MCY7113452.1 retron Ec67 family RNA-directed DNA polymerase/endonuclease [Streptococcus mutans]MCY7121427.1 retron Ec67 family RNA-directed DNA polymerase/endonuclease [Streptococcus mutans]MCY7149219.1 retron Ec67 family RNA-directed DNA polymerase/endonuclease [Streptococcus mutans]
MNKLKQLSTKDDFAELLGFRNSRFINYLLYSIGTDNLYETFTIPKKNGGERIIHAPKKELKFLQKRLANVLWDCYLYDLKSKSKEKKLKIPMLSHAFEKNKSIITNAQVHRNKKYLLNIDLKDYFDSFNFGRVRGFFVKDKDFQVTSEIATVIAQIACYQGKLPQGAPSSPIITNLITRILDYRIVKIAKKYRFTYTRYADDMTFSTNRELNSNKLRATKELENFLAELERLIISSGFEINPKKTRLSNNMQRQEVTGLVVNKKINVKREYIKNTRAMAFKLYKDGTFEIDGKQGTLEQLTGRFAFIFQTDKYNNYLLYKKSLIENNLDEQKYLLGRNSSKKSESKYYWKYMFYNRDLRDELFYNQKHNTYNLPKGFYSISENEKEVYMTLFNSKEKDYKRFLFYKYFFGNDKPMIITEGKTDPLYIKAALKKMYLNYPELVEKVGNNFVFKIEFLNRSNTIEYLFNIPEGGSGLNYLYNYFSNQIPANFFKQRFPTNNDRKDIYKELYPNYIEFFSNLTLRNPKNSTIFLFDNEPSGNPLFKFVNYAKDLQVESNNLDQIRETAFKRITKKGSLYIMATPLLPNMNGGNSSDIEDLILSKNTAPILKGKTFLKNGGSNHYGKEIFSKHILKNYKQYDFSDFIPLLDGMRDNILDYRKK